MNNCKDCGQGVSEEEKHHTLQGWDVTGLFPAMQSESTGLIVRNEIIKCKIKINGFLWKHGIRYSSMNEKLTGDLEGLSQLDKEWV